MASGSPTVETVILRCEMPKPSGSCAVASAGRSRSRLASGSPMPITTMWLSRSSAGRSNWSLSSCSRISPVVRLRITPSRPLAQNTQPIAQPTCELMQTVRRSPSRRSTHSIRWRSWSSRRSFSVPSSALECFAIVVVQILKPPSNCVRRSFERSVMSANDAARRPNSQRRIALARQAGCSRALIHSPSRLPGPPSPSRIWGRPETGLGAGFSTRLASPESAG